MTGPTIHATCVDIAGFGVLLLGKPGSGKSDLCLRLMEAPGTGLGPTPMTARLVADDQTELSAENGRLVARAPRPIAGKLEVRGIGIVNVPHADTTVVRLAAELVLGQGIERLPDPPLRPKMFHGIAVPTLSLVSYEPSAPAKLRTALHMLVQETGT